MGNLKVSVVVRETAERSEYRPNRTRTPMGWDEFLQWLAVKGNVAVADCEKVARLFWQDAIDEQRSEHHEQKFVVPELGEATRNLFGWFKWASEKDGTWAMYVRTDSEAQTYVLTKDPMRTAAAIEMDLGDGETRTLEDMMEEGYKCLAMKGQLDFLEKDKVNENGEQKRGTIMLPTLAEYWETRIRKVWERDSRFRLAHKPVEISTKHDKPSFFFWDSARLKEGPHPNWDSWMLSMPEYARPAFRAWIFGIFDPRNHGRQALWLQDRGYSGKSSVFRSLEKFIGRHAVGSISHGSLGNQFGYASVYGKRLVIYGDNKNPKLLHQEKIHSILGGDIVSIERKGIDPFSAPIHAKLLVASNVPPEVDLFARSEVTRILYIPLHEPPEESMLAYTKHRDGKVMRHKDGTPIFVGGNLEEKLFPEIPAFLATCARDYAELCPNHTDIVLSSEMWEALHTRCASPEHLAVERFVKLELEFGKKLTCSQVDVGELFHDFLKGKSTNYDSSRLRTYLETCGAKLFKSDEGSMYIGVGIKSVTIGGGVK